MKMQIAKYLSLASIMATVAWFFWNPVNWSFQWEPLVVFLASLGAFVSLDWQGHKQDKRSSHKTEVHPSDVYLLNNLVDLLPSTGVIEFLKTHDFLGSFERDEIKPLERFLWEWDNAEHEFQDKEIDDLKARLYESARRFNLLIGKYTSPNKYGFQAVRPDNYEGGQQREAQFEREAEEIGEAADQVVERHQELVRKARQKFGDGTI